MLNHPLIFILMNREDLIQSLSKKTGLSKTQSAEFLGFALEEIAKTLSRGEEVVLTGFGKFSVVERKEREGVNPRTGDKIMIPATKAPKFKAGRILKDAVK